MLDSSHPLAHVAVAPVFIHEFGLVAELRATWTTEFALNDYV